MSFSAFNLNARVLAGIPKNFVVPTPIQSKSIPSVIAGRDILGLAQTGTGKTAAFVLPILNRLIDGKKGRVRSLILAPTRELAEQIRDSVQQLGSKSGLTVTTIYGGISMNLQIQRLRKGVDIVVGCPGRVLDHIQRKTLDLRAVEVLVLDEADHMFDMGFLPTVRKVLAALPKERQNLLFSATMPKEVNGLAMDLLHDPVRVEIEHRTPVKTVSHAIYAVDQAKKADLLFQLLKNSDSESVLIFTRTKHRAKKLSLALVDEGYKATSLQGNLSQAKRQAALNGFRSGKYQILVATDIAARGIDVASVTHVINYDIPDTVEAYTHRIGRTGRAEKTGDAYTFVTHEDESMVRSIERVLGKSIERKEMEGITRVWRGGGSPRTSRGQRSYSMNSRGPSRGFNRSRGGQSNRSSQHAGSSREGRPQGGRSQSNRPQCNRPQSSHSQNSRFGRGGSSMPRSPRGEGRSRAPAPAQ